MVAFYVNTFLQKPSPRQRKSPKAPPAMTQYFHTICIQQHTFLIFVKPWFWTTLLWFCSYFTSPCIKTLVQKRPKNIPRKQTTKVQRKSSPRSAAWRKTWKLTSQSVVQRDPKITLNPIPDHPGIPRWPFWLQMGPRVASELNLETKMATQCTLQDPKVTENHYSDIMFFHVFEGRRHEASAI